MSEKTWPVALDPASLEARTGSTYPEPWRTSCGAREKFKLGDAFGLTAFGANLVRLPPGAMSSQRHWHTQSDELVYVLEGELTLVTDEGEQVLTPGMVSGFKAGVENGHHMINKSEAWAVYLEIGSRPSAEQAHYPDIDLLYTQTEDGSTVFSRKNGEPY